MSVLVIGEENRKNIQTAIEKARSNPVPWVLMKEIASPTPTHDLHIDEVKRVIVDTIYESYPTQSLTLGNVRVAFSFEYQPAGLFRHLSVSVQRKGKLPHPEAVKMIALEFGFSDFPPKRSYRIWKEEYEEGLFVINLLEIEEEKPNA
jgi:hypothetical protein